MNADEEIKQLRERLKALSSGRYHRFNVLLKKEVFEKLQREAKKQKKSMAKTLTEMIKKYE